MKILMVIETSGGGSGRHFVDLAGALISRGHKVSAVYSPLRAESWFEDELNSLPLTALVQLPMRRAVGLGDVTALWKLRRIINSLGPFDVIHGHSSKGGALARMAASKGSARVYTPHAFRTMDPNIGPVSRRLYGGIEALLARSCTDALIAVAPEEAKHAISLGISERKISTILNGLSDEPLMDRNEARRFFGISKADIVIGFVGRLSPQKDPIRFAESIRIANKDNPAIRGIVLGDGELKADVEAEGGGSVAVFSGLKARRFLSAFDIFALTSRYEAMPYVLIEALMAGLPIVASDVGGVSSTVQCGVNGVKLPLDASAQAFADTIVKLMRSASMATMREASLNISQHFKLSEMAAQTEATYKRVAYLH